jgi:hypothetical protein
MKWFHHECAARHDPKLQILGSIHGAKGLGIYWGILEEIGQHSDTFHLKVTGFSVEADEFFKKLIQDPEIEEGYSSCALLDLQKVPRLPSKILAGNLFTSTKDLRAIIRTCVETDLFDPQKWLKLNVLYSSSFEHRADDYTRRMQRRAENVRTDSGQTPDIVRRLSEVCSDKIGLTSDSRRTLSEKVHLEAEQIQKEKEKKNRDRREKDLFVKDTHDEIQAKSDQPLTQRLTSSDFYELLRGEPYLISLTEEGFLEYSQRFRAEIVRSNENRLNGLDWVPSNSELRKLFFGGSEDHKLTMCYHAYCILDEKVHYPELVLRALTLMLKASDTTRIANPFGWMWSCLHGNSDGTLPWVQLLTAKEENGRVLLSQRRVRQNHPP